MGKRTRYSAEFKAKVAIDATRGEQTLSELAAKHGVHANLISQWKRQAIEQMASLFGGGGAEAVKEKEGGGREAARQDRPTPGRAGFFSQGLRSVSKDRRQMCIEQNHPRLSLRRQCRLLSLSRSVFYYTPSGENALNLKLMVLIDRQFL